MTATTHCDICDEKQNEKEKDNWISLSISAGIFKKLPGTNSAYFKRDICQNCSEKILPKILKILNKK